MRAYFFGNMYLSSIQQGIQAAHAVVEMFVKYNKQQKELLGIEPNQLAILNHWADYHKTMVLLNAGYGEEIHNLITFFSEADNPLPWAAFRESREALDSALTTVGIILPEEFYEGAKELKSISGFGENYAKLLPGWERTLAERLNNYGLAR